MGLRLIFLAALVFSIGGCASTGETQAEPVIQAKNKVSRPYLSPRKLAARDCGLFVWTAGDERRFILFSQAQSNEAVWAGDAGETALQITAQNGAPREGQYPQQKFLPLDMTLDLRQPQIIDEGTRYKGGTLTVKSDSSWDKVIPVVGLSVCQPN